MANAWWVASYPINPIACTSIPTWLVDWILIYQYNYLHSVIAITACHCMIIVGILNSTSCKGNIKMLARWSVNQDIASIEHVAFVPITMLCSYIVYFVIK